MDELVQKNFTDRQKKRNVEISKYLLDERLGKILLEAINWSREEKEQNWKH